jgi:hypothetical protein
MASYRTLTVMLYLCRDWMANCFSQRLRAAVYAAAVHLLGSLMVATLTAVLVFGVWYPFPYRELAGGRELFVLIVLVDIVLGPLLTLVLFAPSKMLNELWRDLAIVVALQLGALAYGVWTVWQARPLFLVAEVDRFKVIGTTSLQEGALKDLPDKLQPKNFSGPLTVAIRAPKDSKEKEAVLFESVQGGRDYGERPNFYIPYEDAAALKSLQRARPLEPFLEKFPMQREAAQDLARKADLRLGALKYLPVIARQDWIALLDDEGMIVGFLKGDGF